MNIKAFIRYIAALLLFGLNGIVASQIPMTSYEIVFLRTMIGSILLIVLFLLGKGRFHLGEHRRDTLFIVLSGIAMGGCWLFLYEAYQVIGVSLASLLYYCSPVLIMITSPLLFGEKLTKPKVAGFLVVLAGILLVNGRLTGGNNGWGIFCGAMSAVMMFLVITLNKQSVHILGLENSVLQLTVAFLSVAVYLGLKQGFVLQIPGAAWPWILLLGFVNTGIGCWLYFSSLSELPVQTVAICGYLEPLTAVVSAALLLQEHMTPLQILGAVCILGGAMIGELVPAKASA